ncbi:MAG: DedA family protein [Methanobacteriaceae archaeon]|nr:DedA family protein [Methanobacteriaceae archaeon]
MSIIELLSNFVIYLIETFGYWGIFITMTLESACIPFPSEIIMCFAGFVVHNGKLDFLSIVLVGTLGNLVGSIIAYYIGLIGGRPLLEKYGKYIFITKNKLDLADRWFNKYGNATVFFSRVLPIIRTFISLPAGIAKMDIKKFIVYTTIGAFPWCLLLAYIGIQLGTHWMIVKDYFHILDLIIVIFAVIFIIYGIYKYKKNNN